MVDSDVPCLRVNRTIVGSTVAENSDKEEMGGVIVNQNKNKLSRPREASNKGGLVTRYA